MKSVKNILSIGFLLFIPLMVTSQHKYEREYRIKTEIVPQYAKDFINSISSDATIKWYQETSLNDRTFEAKFKYNSKKYSIEFDTLGKLQDVEFIISKKEINPEVYHKIVRKLDAEYQKWKFQKIQLHYSGNSKDILTAILENKESDLIKIFYEIVLKGKNSKGMQLYEITFTKNGEVQNTLQIIQDKTDHLEY